MLPPLFRRARRVAALALVPALLVLAACGRAPADGRIHITYWEKWTGGEGAAIQATVDAFNASQDRIHVTLVSMAQIDRKLITATAGGTPPDLAGIWLAQVPSFADRGALEPMDPFVEADAVRAGGSAAGATDAFLARYARVYAAMSRYDGRIYALPTTPATIALHWNKTLFREAGLDPERPPRTLAELDDFARRLTRRDPRTGGLLVAGFLPQEPGWWNWANPLWFGGRYFDEAGDFVLAADPASERAFRWVRAYTDEFGRDEVQRFTSGFGSFGSPQSAFFAGKVAMVLQGVWMNNFIRQYAPGLDYGVAPWPAQDEAAAAQPPFTIAEADVIVIPRGARHPEAAWEFIRYLSSANAEARTREELTGMELLCFLQEKNSPLRVWSPYFAERHPHPHIALFRELAESPNAQFLPLVGIWQEISREMNTATDRVRLLEMEPREALDYVQRRVGESWDRHRASVRRQRDAVAGHSP